MYNFDVDVPKEDLNNAIIQDLRRLGLRHGSIPKKVQKNFQIPKHVLQKRGCVFGLPLHLLSSRIVQLQSGVDAEVPNILQEICCCIVQQAATEGLFRKAGSAARQKEMRAFIDQGVKMQFSQHHVIDVANILKYFLRALPEPVLPYAYHDLFLHGLLVEDKVSALLLICLLLPRTHLHVLAYLMEFFHLISELSESNKMNSSNLAIVIAPSLMPVSEKIPVDRNPERIGAHVHIVELLISNADRIGVLPDGVVSTLSLIPSVSTSSLNSDDQGSGITVSTKKKRRRSGSLTRMFNGLKKIVAGKPSPGSEIAFACAGEEAALVSSTTALSTPCVKSAKKRKALDTTSGFSSKKKREVLLTLPQSTALADTPFKKSSPSTSHSSEIPGVCPHPNPSSNQKAKPKSPQKIKHRKFFPTRTFSESDNRSLATGSIKALSGVNNFVTKKQKQFRDRHSANGNFLERSWSAVSSSHWGRRKSRQSDQTRLSVVSTASSSVQEESDSSHDAGDMGIDLSQEEPFDPSTSEDFVQVPKSEYEELKSRMSAIESCLNQELNSVSAPEAKASPCNINAANTVLAVQTVYEKTLEGADLTKDVSTDQLAKRLSRELKIRRSGECKVVRSPSARKIGSLRRRSRERQSPSLRRELRRNKSWHMMQNSVYMPLNSTVEQSPVHLQHTRLRRGRPNTVFTGLPQPTPNRVSKEIKRDKVISILGVDDSGHPPVTRSQARRASSFHGHEVSSSVVPSSIKTRSQVNLAKAALLAHAYQINKGHVELDEKWHDAQELLKCSKDLSGGEPTSRRESIAKLRSENAGKVLATAKLFNAGNEGSKCPEVRKSQVYDIALQRNSEGSQIQELLQGPTLNKFPEEHFRKPTKSDNSLFGDIHVATEKSQKVRNTSPYTKNLSSERSPAVVSHLKKQRNKSSPTQSPSVKIVSNRVKKHSSMKVGRVAHSQPVKRNLSVPVQRIDTDKENAVEKMKTVSSFSRGLSPQNVKEPLVLSDKIQRMSVSPLKDCNRISMPPGNPGTKDSSVSCATPSIKQPITFITPRRKALTPQSKRGHLVNTPLKVIAPSSVTPIQSSQQRSSCLQSNTKAHHKNLKPSYY